MAPGTKRSFRPHNLKTFASAPHSHSTSKILDRSWLVDPPNTQRGNRNQKKKLRVATMFRVSSAVYARKTASSTRCFFVMPVSSYPGNWQTTIQSSYFSTVTGHVKSYNKTNAYGFIIPDVSEGITTNVFVHRSEIAGVTDKTPFGFPYLRQGDRVQFEVRRENNGKYVAHNVRNEDGSLITIYRDATAMTAFLKSSLGVAVYDILDDDNMSEGDKVSNIIEEFEKARSQINKLQATIHAQEEAASEIENAKEDEAAHSKTDEPLDTSMTVTEATDKEESRSVY